MPNTNKTHLYDPEDGGTDMEIVISPDTWWHAVCNPKIKLSHYDYQTAEPTGQTCTDCITKAKEQDPYGLIWNL
jgi:hypothetical protein